MCIAEGERGGLAARLWNAALPLLLLTMLFWAGNTIVGRAVREAVPPFTLALSRWTGASVLLLPFAIGPLRADAGQLRREWKAVLLLALLGVCGFNAFLYTALHYSTATNALLLQSATPAAILLIGWLLFGDRARPLRILAVLISMAGVAIVALHGDAAALRSFRLGPGELMLLAAVIVWSSYTVLLRTRPQVHPLSFLAVTFACGVVAMLPLALWELGHGARLHLDGGALAAMAYVALFPSLIAYLLYNRSVELIGAARAGQFNNFMPLFGAVLAALLLDEPIRGYHWVGGGLILAGTLLFMRGGREAPTEA